MSVEPESMWHVGDKGIRGQAHKDSGVSFVVSDASSAQQLASDLQQFLKRNRFALSELTGRGLTAELDVGVTVGDSQQYVALVPFAPEVLRALADLRIGLCVSAYPTSNEANAPAV
jgi:hypothetical protein